MCTEQHPAPALFYSLCAVARWYLVLHAMRHRYQNMRLLNMDINTTEAAPHRSTSTTGTMTLRLQSVTILSQ